MDDKEADEIFKQLNIDGNGSMKFAQFTFAAVNAERFTSEESLTKAFQTIDRHGRGAMSLKDIKTSFKTDFESENQLK